MIQYKWFKTQITCWNKLNSIKKRMVALFVFMILPRDEIHVVFNTSIFSTNWYKRMKFKMFLGD